MSDVKNGDSNVNINNAAFDFRSDTVTTPTPSMLAALTAGIDRYEGNTAGTITTSSHSTFNSASTSASASASASSLPSTSPVVFGDDVYGEDTSTAALEQRIASLAGHEAGLLMLSGTVANQIALRTHLSLNRPLKEPGKAGKEEEHDGHEASNTGRSEGTTVRGPPYSILCDARAHILTSEAGGASALSGAMVQGVMPRNERYLTLAEDVIPNAIVSTPSPVGPKSSHDDTNIAEPYSDYNDIDIHATPTALVALENTLHGMIYPLEEMRKVANWTRSKGIALHLDGARLWEAAAAASHHQDNNTNMNEKDADNDTITTTNTTTLHALKSYASLADSTSLCLSKGLCAPIGTVLVGSNRFIRHARRIRKMLGGGVRMAGLVAVPARVALEEVFMGSGSASGSASVSAGSTLRSTHATVKKLAARWTGLGFRLRHPAETNQLWLDLASARISEERMQGYLAEAGIRGGAGGGRFVVHAQICGEAVRRLEGVMGRCFEEGRGTGATEGRKGK